MTSQQFYAKEETLTESRIELSHDVVPTLPETGDILFRIPKYGKQNEHYEMRISGEWFVRWPGFAWETATDANSWFGK